MAVAKADAAGKSASDKKSVTSVGRPLTVSVYLVGGTVLTGTLLDATEIPLRATFGHVQVPLAEVAGIKLAQEEHPASTVVLYNGDVFP